MLRKGDSSSDSTTARQVIFWRLVNVDEPQ
jgi:hypothetical protein